MATVDLVGDRGPRRRWLTEPRVRSSGVAGADGTVRVARTAEGWFGPREESWSGLGQRGLPWSDCSKAVRPVLGDPRTGGPPLTLIMKVPAGQFMRKGGRATTADGEGDWRTAEATMVAEGGDGDEAVGNRETNDGRSSVVTVAATALVATEVA